MLDQWIPNIMDKLPEFYKAIIDTLIMLSLSGVIAFFIGTFIGLVFIITRHNDIWEHRIVNFILGKIIDLFRAIPFIILVFWLSPLTAFFMGTTIQLKGAIFPLIIGTIPFFARQIESALAQVDHGLIEASQSMGCSPIDIIFRVYLKESIPAMIRACSITLISLIGCIAMVGVVGGGGIGDFAIRYGYNGYQEDVTLVCVLVLLLLTVCIQGVCAVLIKRFTH